MSALVYCAIGAIAGALVIYFLLKPKLYSSLKKDEETQNINKKISEENNQLKLEQATIKIALDGLKNEKVQLSDSLKQLEELKNNQESHLQKDYDDKVKLLELKYKNLEEDYLNDYYSLMEEIATDCSTQVREKKENLDSLKIEMDSLKSEVQAALEEKKRNLLEAQQKEFYKLHLQELDLQEIKLIKSIEPHFRDAMPLNKIIWSAYYKPTFNILRGKVLSDKIICGIYKLTNEIDGRVYIGQAKDVADRWSQHIKSGLGAVPAPNNKLYTSMSECGPENFSYVLVEECAPEELNEKEKFWIEFYDSKNLGLNDTVGNSTGGKYGTNY